jgi:hypothetical protein
MRSFQSGGYLASTWGGIAIPNIRSISADVAAIRCCASGVEYLISDIADRLGIFAVVVGYTQSDLGRAEH